MKPRNIPGSSSDDDRTAQIVFEESNVTSATSDHERQATTPIARSAEHVVEKRPIDVVNTNQVDEPENKKVRHILDDRDEEN